MWKFSIICSFMAIFTGIALNLISNSIIDKSLTDVPYNILYPKSVIKHLLLSDILSLSKMTQLSFLKPGESFETVTT